MNLRSPMRRLAKAIRLGDLAEASAVLDEYTGGTADEISFGRADADRGRDTLPEGPSHAIEFAAIRARREAERAEEEAQEAARMDRAVRLGKATVKKIRAVA